MNIKALITLVVLGSSSVAMARPVAPSYQGGIIVRDHRDHRAPAPLPTPAPAPLPAPVPAPAPSFVPLWVTLGAESRIVDGEMAFRVKPTMGRFTSLQLQSSSGKSLIYRVLIQFSNGKTQAVELNQYLNASNRKIMIDLDGEWARSIAKVTVVGRNARNSSYSVLAI